MPPRLSLARSDQGQAAASGYSLDQDYAQEEVVSPDTTSLDNEMQIEIVTNEEFEGVRLFSDCFAL